MSPFKEKPVKWEGNDEGGRYKEVNGYKYDIVTQSVVKKAERMPEHYLADTSEEAQALYDRYERLLNNFAYSYAVSTGLSKTDLFGEALIGLARAYRDWMPDRSDNFKTYAIFRIKDALNEFVLDNSASISVPAYIKKAYNHLSEIKSICESYTIDYTIIAVEQELPVKLDEQDAIRCAELVNFLISAANRAKVDYRKFLERIEVMPEDVSHSDQLSPETSQREQCALEAALIVEKLKTHMDKTELLICEGIMLDKSYRQIGEELGYSISWVHKKIEGLRKKILRRVKENNW